MFSIRMNHLIGGCVLMAVSAIPALSFAGAYGPRPDTGCTGVKLRPGEDIQTAVNSNPANTTFCLDAGMYSRQTIVPKAGNRFIGAMGAVLDGELRTRRAFDGVAPDVVIQNLKITRYTAPAQDAAVHADNSSNWTVKDNEISYNAGRGLDLGNRMRLVGNYIHHNLQLGIGGKGTGIVVDSNDISFNNYTRAYDPGWEAGGTKFWATVDATVTNNYVHDNIGPGLWADNDNIRIVFRHNWVESDGTGIFQEIGYDATIVDNVVKTNVPGCPGWLWCAGIQIAGSGGTDGKLIDISGNVVIVNGGDKANGIALIQQARGVGAYGPHFTRNVYVHNNFVDLSAGGSTGAVEDTGDRSIFASRNNRFESNTYYLGGRRDAFAWNGSIGNFARLQSFGLDTAGAALTGSIAPSLVGKPEGWSIEEVRRKLGK